MVFLTMAYSADIDAISPDHRWSFDNTTNDQVGTAHGTASTTTFVLTPICEDVTYSLFSDTVADRVTLPTTADINNSAQTRKAIAGWFMGTAYMPPPKRIYGEGNATTCFHFLFGYGNNVMFECVEPTNFTLQVYGPPLVPNRAYHLCGIFEGNGYSNAARFYVDGIEQLNASPVNRQPGTPDLNSRGVGEFGDPVGTVGVGGAVVIVNGPTNGYWNQWASWNGAPAVLTSGNIRSELFEKGALADDTISSDTELNMQSALDLLSTTRTDAPLSIAIEDSTSGNFTLTANGMTFAAECSLHLRYEGNDTLTWINTNGSNAYVVAATGLGSIIVKNRVTMTITVKNVSTGSVINGARVYIEADTGGDLVAGTEMINTTTNVSGIATQTIDLSSDQPIIGRVRHGTASTYYIGGVISGPVTKTGGLNETILLLEDE